MAKMAPKEGKICSDDQDLLRQAADPADLADLADPDDQQQDDEGLLHLPPETSRTSARRPVFPEVVGFLYVMALTMQLPLLQFWLFDHFANQYHFVKEDDKDACTNLSLTNSSDLDKEKRVQEETNKYIMFPGFVSSFLAIFPTLFLGPLMDRFGRRFVLAIGFAGLLSSQLLIVLIIHFRLSPNLLFASSGLLGLSGNFGLFFAGIFGVVADITSPGKERALRVALTEAALAIAASISYIIAGVWVKAAGYIWPMSFALCVGFIAALFTLFFIPETCTRCHSQPFSCKFFFKCFEFYVKDTVDKRRVRLIILLLCFVTFTFSFTGESNFSILFLLHQPFCWQKDYITIFNGSLILARWTCVLVFLLLGKRCISEPVFALIGALSIASGFLIRGLADSNLLIFIGAGVTLLGDLVPPMCRTIMSKSVSANEQGALFGGMGVLQMVMTAVSGLAMSSAYDLGLTLYLGLPYLILAGLLYVNSALLLFLAIQTKRQLSFQVFSNEVEA